MTKYWLRYATDCGTKNLCSNWGVVLWARVLANPEILRAMAAGRVQLLVTQRRA